MSTYYIIQDNKKSYYRGNDKRDVLSLNPNEAKIYPSIEEGVKDIAETFNTTLSGIKEWSVIEVTMTTRVLSIDEVEPVFNKSLYNRAMSKLTSDEKEVLGLKDEKDDVAQGAQAEIVN